MQFIEYFRRHIYVSFLSLSAILLISIPHRCEAKKDKISPFHIKVELISPSTISFDGKAQQIVILEKEGDSIKCYQYGDLEKSIRIFNAGQYKIVDGEENYLEGYLLSDTNESISILVIDVIGQDLFDKHHITVEFHEKGTIANIPFSEIKGIKVWKKGRPGRGAIIGAGIGCTLAAIGVASNPEDESIGVGVVLTYSALVVPPLSALLGAAFGSVNKRVQHFTINGYSGEYYKARRYLDDYFVDLPPTGEMTTDDILM